MLRTNVLQGEVQRSWMWISPMGVKHVIDLWHDTVTGVRSVAVGLEEVPGSMGSSPFFTTEPHHINFTVGHEHARGMVIIEKAGLFSFRYTCVVNGRPLKATLQGLADENEERFYVSILATANAYTTKEKAVTWYELTVTRRSDDARTIVHRRYREFQCLFEQVHAAFKGHHLRSSLPELPGRQLKLLVDHTDTAFVEERRLLLETAMGKLLSVPHVCAMVPVQVFLGFFDRLKEHSVVFTQRDLGMSITRTVVPEDSIVVSRVKEVGQGGQQTRVMVGDTVSKVNGEPSTRILAMTSSPPAIP
ncbi:px domain containing protein [Nannochloropsis oceanica]